MSNPITRLFLPLVLLGLGGSFSFAFQSEIDEASLGRMKSDIQIIASDKMGGRGPGTEGIDLAADFIVERWKSLGLKTDLFDGGPFQKFEINGPMDATVPDKNHLTIQGPNGVTKSFKLGEAFSPLALGSNQTFEGELVFVGYGITANKNNLHYDDFAGLDVKGKVVVMLRKEPQQADANSPFEGKDPSDFSFFTAKQANAAAHEVAAMILINDQVTAKVADVLLPPEGAGKAVGSKRVPAMFVKRDQITDIIQQVTGKSLDEIENAIDQDLQPRSAILTGWKASGEVEVKEAKQPVKNVLAVFPGEGELAKEIVVIGAHYDHVGMGGVGSLAPGTYAIHNGADDNGSGTVALLEVTKRMVDRLKGRDRRQLVFIAFTAEERGLLGSQHYCRNPRFALEDTVAMVNMDMVGRLTDNKLEISGTGTAANFNSMIDRLNERYQFKLTKKPEGVGPSDHATFFEEKIPVFHFFTGLHNDYHRPSDDWDKINVPGMVRIVDMMCDAIDEIATAKERPEFSNVAGPGNPFSQPRERARLQLQLKDETLEVLSLEEGGAAELAGVQVGDQLLQLGNRKLDNREVLAAALDRRKPDEEVTLKVMRKGAEVRLLLKLGK